MKSKQKWIRIAVRLRRERPEVHPNDVDLLVRAGRVRVGGVIIHNPQTMVDAHAPLVITDVEVPRELRGTIKLRAALDAFGVDVRDRVALDLGASSGGFTTELLARGARRVYAVDVGYGQLITRLRGDPRVINLERTNLSELDRAKVPDVIDVITMDLSYLSIANAIGQIERVAFAERATLVALVKPMFELALARAPTHLVADTEVVERAIERASDGVRARGWDVVGAMRSPVTGGRGALEAWLHARAGGGTPAPPKGAP